MRRLLIVLSLSLSACVDGEQRFVSDVSKPTPSESALIEDGRTVAQANCSLCHSIEGAGRSPNRKAPPFRHVLRRYDAEVLMTELSEGMIVAHAAMPKFQFKPEAADALIAYLRSVQSSDEGLRLVEERCAHCHAVGRSDTSPYPGAQAFRNLGRRWRRDQLRDALQTGIIAEHDNAETQIPPMKLDEPEIEAFLRYLDSIADPNNPAPSAP